MNDNTEYAIGHEENHAKGRYFIRLSEGVEAELTYSKAGEARLIADHTGVPKAHEGQGIAGVLVLRMAQDARAGGKKIVPLCPYVKAWFERHPDWADVRA